MRKILARTLAFVTGAVIVALLVVFALLQNP